MNRIGDVLEEKKENCPPRIHGVVRTNYKMGVRQPSTERYLSHARTQNDSWLEAISGFSFVLFLLRSCSLCLCACCTYVFAVGVSDVCVYHRRGSCEDESRQTTQRTNTFIYLKFFFVQAFLIVERDRTLVRSAQVEMCAFSYRIGIYGRLELW